MKVLKANLKTAINVLKLVIVLALIASCIYLIVKNPYIIYGDTTENVETSKDDQTNVESDKVDTQDTTEDSNTNIENSTLETSPSSYTDDNTEYDEEINLTVDEIVITATPKENWLVLNIENTSDVTIKDTRIGATYTDSAIQIDDNAGIQRAFDNFRAIHDNAEYKVIEKNNSSYIIFLGTDNSGITYTNIYQTIPKANTYLSISARDFSGATEPMDLANIFALSF